MKKILTPLLLIVLSIQAFAQSFSVSSDTSVFSDNFSNVYVNGYYLPVNVNVKITNNTSSAKSMRWVRNNNVLPSGWNTSVCDNNACYPSATTTKDFTLGPDSSCQLTVDFFINSSGYALTTLHVFEIGDTINQVNPAFVANIAAPNGVAAIKKVKDLHLSPVPARDNLSVEYDNALHPTKVEVYNILGKMVSSKKITSDAATQADIDVSGLDKGLYFLRFYTGDNKVLTRQFTKD